MEGPDKLACKGTYRLYRDARSALAERTGANELVRELSVSKRNSEQRCWKLRGSSAQPNDFHTKFVWDLIKCSMST